MSHKSIFKKIKKMNECLRVAQRKFAYSPSDYAFAFQSYQSEYLASVYERSIDAFAFAFETTRAKRVP